MTNEEYEKALEKASDIGHFISSLADRCYITENARLKVGDITTLPGSTELYEVSDVRVHNFGYEYYDHDLYFPDFVNDFDILYVLMQKSDPNVKKRIRQKELFENQQKTNHNPDALAKKSLLEMEELIEKFEKWHATNLAAHLCEETCSFLEKINTQYTNIDQQVENDCFYLSDETKNNLIKELEDAKEYIEKQNNPQPQQTL